MLSVIMIVKDEAHCLGDCLGSVADVADEIIVCDTGSSDDTVAVAEGFGAVVARIPWRDDFAWARNQSIAAARGDWLLHLDADETLDPAGARRIRALVDADGEGADAVELVLANYCDAPRAWRWVGIGADDPHGRGKSGYVRTELLRLFRNGRGFAYREPVHENITQSVIEAGGVVRREEIFIHHHGYDLDSARVKEKQQKYLAIAREKAVASPEDAKCLHDLAEQALACGYAEEAEAACRRALVLDGMSLNVKMTLANLLLNRGALAEAAGLLEAVVATGAVPVQALVALGAALFHQGRIDDAAWRIDAAVEADPRAPFARLYRARILDLRGESARALGELKLVRDMAPQIGEFAHRVRAHELRGEGERLFQVGHPEPALACFVEGLRLDGEDPLLHNNLGVALHALGETEKARAAFARALEIVPGMADAAENLAGTGG